MQRPPRTPNARYPRLAAPRNPRMLNPGNPRLLSPGNPRMQSPGTVGMPRAGMNRARGVNPLKSQASYSVRRNSAQPQGCICLISKITEEKKFCWNAMRSFLLQQDLNILIKKILLDTYAHNSPFIEIFCHFENKHTIIYLIYYIYTPCAETGEVSSRSLCQRATGKLWTTSQPTCHSRTSKSGGVSVVTIRYRISSSIYYRRAV